MQTPKCKQCKEVDLIFDRHQFVCPRCAQCSTLVLEDSFYTRVPFKDREQYKKKPFEVDKRLGGVKRTTREILARMDVFTFAADPLFQAVQDKVDKLLERCFPPLERKIKQEGDSAQLKRDFPMPREAEIVASACILIVLSNMHQFNGRIRTWEIVPDKDKLKKVLKLKSRIESSEMVNVFNSGIVTRAPESEKSSNLMERICNELDLPYKFTCFLLKRFQYISDTILMDGRHTSFLIAGVILHCLSPLCRACPHKTQLVPEQLQLLSLRLNIKPASLPNYEEQLGQKCCPQTTA